MIWGEPEREQHVAMSSVNCEWTLAAVLHSLSLAVSLSTRQPCNVSYNLAALSPALVLTLVRPDYVFFVIPTHSTEQCP